MQGSMCNLFPPRVAEGAWQGHWPITSVALLEFLDHAAAGRLDFSRAERILYIACEFWAAANAHELGTHIDAESIDPLADARHAFSAVGAIEVTGILRRSGPRPDIAAMEEQLLAASESVDQLIANFARRYLCEARRLCEKRHLCEERAFAGEAAADSRT